MPVRSDIVGYTQQVTHEVTPRWALAFSAALGFTGADCLDDAAPGGAHVPGMFCVCLEWALVGADARAEAIGLSPQERRRGVHASQDSRFHRPIRPGMRVVTTSTIAYARATSAGAFLLTRLESREAQSGELLVTSWSGAVVRGVSFDGAVQMALPPDAPAVPDEVAPAALAGPVATIPTGRGLPHVYSECAQIWNPIHTERAVALAAGLPDIILHGTITWALAGEAVVQAAAGGDLRRLRRLSGRFRAPVIPGDSFTVHHEAADGRALFTAAGSGGELVLSSGLVEFD